ncbi:MAG TPA: hypothetical protein VFD66_01800 [Verrucomicrobiae bacterium]|nr:hypothetical protein [Verrucomicrobiae bacterium]
MKLWTLCLATCAIGLAGCTSYEGSGVDRHDTNTGYDLTHSPNSTPANYYAPEGPMRPVPSPAPNVAP